MARSALGWMLLFGLACAGRVEATPGDMPGDGSWALEFQLQPAFYGSTSYGIATKYHTSDRSALRLGFLVALDTEKGDASTKLEQLAPTDSTSATYAYDIDLDARSGSVFLHYVRYATLAEHFGLSLDVGPVFAWSWNKETDKDRTVPPSFEQTIRTYEWDQKSYGFEVQAGFEWHFTRRLSLAGRYGLSAVRNEGHQTFSSETISPTSSYRNRRESVGVSDGVTVQTTSSVFSLIAYW